MIPRPIITLALAAMVAAAADPPDDLLRFANGDQLHGRFAGIGEGGRISWQRPDVTDAIALETAKVRQIVLRGGRPARGIDSIAHARLVGGDRIPGTIVALDEDALILETPYAGRLTIPRAQLDLLAPLPFGGCVRYTGPFQPDGWRIIAGNPAGQERPDDAPATDVPPAANRNAADPAAPAWAFSRAAWYSAEKIAGVPLVRDDGMGEAAVLRFRVAWRNQVGLSVAFHADFAKPPAPAGDGQAKDANARRGTLELPYQFGNAYVLGLNTHYAMLYRCGYDDDGRPFTNHMQNTSNSFRLPQSGESEIEIRSDRRAGRLLLFVDGEFSMQWDESGDPFKGKGGGFGFLVSNAGMQVRISDILVADWNGMVDSARSMEAPDRDVVLLTSGTDRFSGRVKAVHDDQVELASSYADMRIPLSRVAEIHFARDSLAKPADTKAGQLVVHLHPIGRISGSPLHATAERISLASPQIGELDVLLDFANLLDLQPRTNFVDDWDVEF